MSRGSNMEMKTNVVHPVTKLMWHIRALRVILMLTCINSTCCSELLSHFQGIPGCKKDFILPKSNFRSYTTVSVVECVTICGRTLSCYSVNICASGKGYTCDIMSYISSNGCTDLVPGDGCRHLEHCNAEALMAANPCLNGGTYNGSDCHCVPGFAGTWCERYLKSCSEGKSLGFTVTGFFKIQPAISSVAYTVFCNLRAGTIWAMKRVVNPPPYCPPDTFNRTWQEYKKGFGTNDCGFFLGLDTMHTLTSLRSLAGLVEYQFNLYNELVDFDKDSSMNLATTIIGDESSNYEISFHSEWKHDWMTGDAAFDDRYTPRRFCTWDNDCSGCSKSEGGGWWFTPSCGGAVMTAADPDKVVWPVDGVDKQVKIAYLQMDDHGAY